MKKILSICILLITLINNNVLADAAINLKDRLDKVSSFYASFVQKITDVEGNVTQEGQINLWVKRPNLFNWHMTEPDENILISDGKTLWLYNPLVEQVTIVWLKDVINDIPFALIANNKLKDWQQFFNIKQNGDDFLLTPKYNSSNSENIINISQNGTINKFSIIDQDGQCSNYELKFQRNYEVDVSKFVFTPPKNVTIDDQRFIFSINTSKNITR